MGRKLKVYAGRTRYCFYRGQLLEFFRRSKSLKFGVRNFKKASHSSKNRSDCTDRIQN